MKMVFIDLFVKMAKKRKFYAKKILGSTREYLDTDKKKEFIKKIIKNKEKYSVMSAESM